MDAYDISEKIKKYWCALVPKASGEISKPKNKIKVVISTPEGFREVVGVRIEGENLIKLVLDEE